MEVTGGLVAPLDFKSSVGLNESRVGSIPIHLRHLPSEDEEI